MVATLQRGYRDAAGACRWYRMLSIVGLCQDGTQIAHDLSRPHPKYSAAETEEKLHKAMGAAGPATCAFIEHDLGQAQYCSQCKYRGKVKSPIVLGVAKRPRPSAESLAPAGPQLPRIINTRSAIARRIKF